MCQKPYEKNTVYIYLPRRHKALIFFYCQATREAILNRSTELSEARLHTFHNTTAVYDLLTIALVKRTQFNMLSEAGYMFVIISFQTWMLNALCHCRISSSTKTCWIIYANTCIVNIAVNCTDGYSTDCRRGQTDTLVLENSHDGCHGNDWGSSFKQPCHYPSQWLH